MKKSYLEINKMISAKLNAIHNGYSYVNAIEFSNDSFLDSEYYKTNVNKYNQTIDLLRSVIKNLVLSDHIHSCMIYGSAGIGKSYNILEVLNQLQKRNKNLSYYQIKGKVTSTQFYAFLAKHHNENDILIFDDCDTVFTDVTTMNLVKAATDSYEHRIVSYMSPYIESQGLPTEVEFKGKLILITNQSIIGNEHYNALRNRMLLFTLELDWDSKYCKSIEIVINSPKYRRSSVYKRTVNYIIDYVNKRKDVFRVPDYSLRTFNRLVDAYELAGEDKFDKFVHNMHEFNWSLEDG